MSEELAKTSSTPCAFGAHHVDMSASTSSSPEKTHKQAPGKNSPFDKGQLTNEADVAKGSRANASGCQPELSRKRRNFSGQVGPKSARHAGTITSCCPPKSATVPKSEPADSTQTVWCCTCGDGFGGNPIHVRRMMGCTGCNPPHGHHFHVDCAVYAHRCIHCPTPPDECTAPAMSSHSDVPCLDYVALLDHALSKMSDSNERSQLRADFDNGLDCKGHNEQLHGKFMETLQGVLDSQLRQVLQPAQQSMAKVSQPAQQSKSSKRRQRIRAQEARGELGPTTQFGVCRSLASSMGKVKYKRFLAQRRRLIEQVCIVSAQQELAN